VSNGGNEALHLDGAVGHFRTTMAVEGSGSAVLLGPTVASLSLDGTFKTLRLRPWQRSAKQRRPAPSDTSTKREHVIEQIIRHYQPWLVPTGVGLIFVGPGKYSIDRK
jgi:hypothetical protein